MCQRLPTGVNTCRSEALAVVSADRFVPLDVNVAQNFCDQTVTNKLGRADHAERLLPISPTGGYRRMPRNFDLEHFAPSGHCYT